MQALVLRGHCAYRVKMAVFTLDWLMERCQDANVTEELGPGLFGVAAQSRGCGRVIGASSASGEGLTE